MARTVKIKELSFTVRALQRKERRKLSRWGFGPFSVSLMLANSDKAVDAFFETILAPEENKLREQLTVEEETKLFIEAAKETYGAPDESKN